jgi:hypothetical protein
MAYLPSLAPVTAARTPAPPLARRDGSDLINLDNARNGGDGVSSPRSPRARKLWQHRDVGSDADDGDAMAEASVATAESRVRAAVAHGRDATQRRNDNFSHGAHASPYAGLRGPPAVATSDATSPGAAQPRRGGSYRVGAAVADPATYGGGIGYSSYTPERDLAPPLQPRPPPPAQPVAVGRPAAGSGTDLYDF